MGLPGLRRVLQKQTAHKAYRQGDRTQCPEGPPDALHDPKSPHCRAHEYGEEGTAQAHRPADDAGGQPLAVGVPLLGAGLDGRIQKRRAQPRRDAERQKERLCAARRQQARRKKAAAEQGGAPQARAAGAVPVLQEAAQHAPHTEGRDEDAKRIPRPLLRQAVFLHDRLLEHAPRRRKPREHLNGGPGGKDRPRVFCCKLLFHRFTSKSVQFAIVCPFGLTIRQFPL